MDLIVKFYIKYIGYFEIATLEICLHNKKNIITSCCYQSDMNICINELDSKFKYICNGSTGATIWGDRGDSLKWCLFR